MWLWWGLSTTSRECFNSTNMMVLVDFFHYSISFLSILFMGLVLLTQLISSFYLVPKGAPTWCPVLGELQVALVWSILRVPP